MILYPEASDMTFNTSVLKVILKELKNPRSRIRNRRLRAGDNVQVFYNTKNLEQKVFIILRLKSSGRKLLKILRVCIYI